MSRNVRGCSQFPRMSHSDSPTYRWNLRFFLNVQKIRKTNSRTRLESFSI